MSKDAYYFSHDSNARNDVRMIKLRRMGGLESVGLFWCVIEMLREADNYELPTSTIEDICYDFRCDVATFELLFICELLTQNDSVFYSNSLKNRMITLDEIKQKRAIAGQKGGKSKANAKQMLSNKSKVNKSKVNEIKEEREPIIPTLEEVRLFVYQSDYNVDSKLIYDYYSDLNWHDSKGNPVLNWKNKIRTVWFKPENKKQYKPEHKKINTND